MPSPPSSQHSGIVEWLGVGVPKQAPRLPTNTFIFERPALRFNPSPS